MNVGSLFTGIGGFDLGLERAGMRVVWQCESDPGCRRVLADHWPDVPRYEDVRGLRGAARPQAPDVLCGGAPCQPVSRSGDRLVQADARWLWPEFSRLVGDLRPQYVLLENVTGLLDRGMGDVLRDLAACGFDAEWDCLRASAFGASHPRDRVWLVAYPAREHGPSPRVLEPGAIRRAQVQSRGLHRELMADGRAAGDLWGSNPPDVPVLIHGVPESVAANGWFGNALVPQIAEWIGRRIMSYEAA